MITDRCANPECDDNPDSGTRDRWVQIEEIQLVGETRGQGPMQRRFAAVACSKRCAIAVLTAAADADDAAAAGDAGRRERLYAKGWNA